MRKATIGVSFLHACALSRLAPHRRHVALAHAVDPRTIMETLGHFPGQPHTNTYSHVLRARQADAGPSSMRFFLGKGSDRGQSSELLHRSAGFVRKSGEPHFRELEPARALGPGR